MTLDDIWSDFSGRMAEIELMQRSIKSSAQEEMKVLNQFYAQFSNNPELRDASISMHNMIFRNARSGKTSSYQHKEQSIKDHQLGVLLRKNRQYQWLLAEAYEEFEDFIHLLYAYCGYSDPNFWPLADYGKIKRADIASMDFQWYLNQSNGKKGGPRSILQAFRQAFALLPGAETKNHIQLNLAFAIVVIEKLRHIIVHNAGKTSDQEAFIELVAKDAGVLNNGKVTEESRDFIAQFFGEDQYANMVALLEVRVRPELPFDIHVCRFGILSGVLMSYAYLLVEMVKVYVHPRESQLAAANT